MPKPIENVACHCLQFRRSTANVIEFYDRKLAPSGVSIRQYSLLKAIGNNQGCNVRQLGEVTVLDRSTLARTLKPLIRQGLVINDKAPGARDSRLVLSPRGETVRQQAADLWAQAQTEFEQVLGTKRLAALEDALLALQAL